MLADIVMPGQIDVYEPPAALARRHVAIDPSGARKPVGDGPQVGDGTYIERAAIAYDADHSGRPAPDHLVLGTELDAAASPVTGLVFIVVESDSWPIDQATCVQPIHGRRTKSPRSNRISAFERIVEPTGAGPEQQPEQRAGAERQDDEALRQFGRRGADFGKRRADQVGQQEQRDPGDA
jgi:hypothetical protein